MMKPFPKMLAQPAQRALMGAGISTIEDLGRYSESEIQNLHGMGPNAMQKLKGAMFSCNVTFKSLSK